jgi:D-sedoheptulose 7-phosphate isomerase
VRDAILAKARESAETKVRFFEANAERVEACAHALADRFTRGGRLFTFGNGGSACDAQHVALEFIHPIIEKRRALPAMALSVDAASITSVGNDSDFSRTYAETLAVLSRPEDAALGISTSGSSANVLRGLRRARDSGLLTIGFAGRDGGAMRDVCKHCFVVESWSIHRIQETHVALLHLLWDALHVALGEDDVL